MDELNLSFRDNEWPDNGCDHDRVIARALVFDDEGYFYFVRADRDDAFGKAVHIETPGGGVEDGEDLETAIRRELDEELGAEVKVICRLGVVSDYYNVIKRHNLSNYFLCKIISFGKSHMTEDEIRKFHLSKTRLTLEEALEEYKAHEDTGIGRLISRREVPFLKRAAELLAPDCGFQVLDKRFRFRTGGLIVCKDRILFVRTDFGDGYLYVIGGAVRIGESSKACIEREIFEEVGFKAEAGAPAVITENFFMGKGGVIDGCDCHALEFYYIINVTEEQARSFREKSDEGEDLVWVPVSELGEHDIRPAFLKERMNEILTSNEIIHVINDQRV